MSADIKIAHTSSPSQSVKYKGKCYNLVSADLPGAYEFTVDDMDDFFASCAACQSQVDVPATCPCASWGSFPCGDPDDLIYQYYTVSMGTLTFDGCVPTTVAIDTTLWSGNLQAVGAACYWQPYGEGQVRYAGSTYGNDVGTLYVTLELVASTYWKIILTSGLCRGVFLKYEGQSPAGTYQVGDYGVAYTGTTNYARTPTTLTVAVTE